MNKDYENFVERMGSFEDVLELNDDENQNDEKNSKKINIDKANENFKRRMAKIKDKE